jgi:predicted ATP-grasp superfamily ATP-dependent carboligase
MPPAEPASEKLLICALSGRALAESAKRGGFAPIVLDRFGDLDTTQAAEVSAVVPAGRKAPFARAALLRAAGKWAPAPTPLIWGSGFDGAPELLAGLARGREVLGNRPEQVRRVSDPFAFAATCKSLGVPTPRVRAEFPGDPSCWLVKRRGAAGGWHVRPATGRVMLHPQDYLQERVEGRPISVLLLGDGRQTMALAVSQQWSYGAPARFTGVLLPAQIGETTAARLCRTAILVSQAHAIAGLASADFMLADNGSFHLLEVNARPGASLEAAELALGLSLVQLHVGACRGRLPKRLPAPAAVAATEIVWADRDLQVPAAFAWPDWAGDRTPPGRTVGRGQPLATLRVRSSDTASAHDQLIKLRKVLLAAMQSQVPASMHRTGRADGQQ